MTAMLVATQSFAATYDGELIGVRRGRTRVAPDHPLARMHPHRFVPDDDPTKPGYAVRCRTRGFGADERFERR
jgi:hypothetical protein